MPLVYFAFDLLHLDGRDLRRASLDERKTKLAELLHDADPDGSLRYSEHFVGRGPEFLREACRKGLEGIISKRRDRPYVKGRGGDWLKSKCVQTAEFVVGGFTPPKRSRAGLGALLLGYHDDGELVYAGRVGTGFSDSMLRELRRHLDGSAQDDCPFAGISQNVDVRGAQWVAPRMVAQVRFANWTDDGLLRHASFQGLREDKPATNRHQGRNGAKPRMQDGSRRERPNRLKRANWPECG